MKAASDPGGTANGDPSDPYRAGTRSRHAPPRSHHQVHADGRADLRGSDRQDAVHGHAEGRRQNVQPSARQGIDCGPPDQEGHLEVAAVPAVEASTGSKTMADLALLAARK